MQPIAENTISIPAFLSKLWKMVNDPSTDHLICWSSGGNSFYIQNQAQFWYKLLPLYYKHNNMSSFVRQLNMYGFHKMSSFENGTMDADKDEIQFFHPYFQRDQPELLKLIKRKVTATKGASDHTTSSNRIEDLRKVLDDVKQIRGKQASVDSQLSEMKHENSVLWRELAVLRQKHMKQQQIVNKLIQFLVTCVQPRMNGVVLKRRYPLMLNESPPKKMKSAASNSAVTEGPTIHELDAADALTSEFLVEEELEPEMQPEKSTTSVSNESKKVQSPSTPHSTTTTASQTGPDEEPPSENPNDLFWENPEFIYIKPEDLQLSEQTEAINELQSEVFLNPTTQDVLLSELTNGSYNTGVLGSKPTTSGKKAEEKTAEMDMTVATRDPMLGLNRLNSVEDLDLHLDSTQSELDQLKDILNGCNSLDANALLGLFNDESPDYGLSYARDRQVGENDPMVSGSELATYDSGAELIDFSELFDDSSEAMGVVEDTAAGNVASTVNTPQVEEVVAEPVFPTPSKSNRKLMN